VLQCNSDTGHYENTLITCARCGSKRVTPPYSKWSPKNYKSVYKEILENREEFKNLRKEKNYHANTLPVLWKS
jgi:DNA-directed RNA polymerase subunit RPC12/RpoP